MNIPIIRGHHLESAKLTFKIPYEAMKRGLIDLGYIQDSKDPFLNFTYYGLKKLFENPEQEFNVVVGGLDFLCHNCPMLTRDICNPCKPTKTKPKGMNFLTKYEGETADLEILKKYNLQPGTYSVKQIRQRMRF